MSATKIPLKCQFYDREIFSRLQGVLHNLPPEVRSETSAFVSDSSGPFFLGGYVQTKAEFYEEVKARLTNAGLVGPPFITELIGGTNEIVINPELSEV